MRGKCAGGSHLLSEMKVVSFMELLNVIFWEQVHHYFHSRAQAVFITLHYLSLTGPSWLQLWGCSPKGCVTALLCWQDSTPETNTDFCVLSFPA